MKYSESPDALPKAIGRAFFGFFYGYVVYEFAKRGYHDVVHNGLVKADLLNEFGMIAAAVTSVGCFRTARKILGSAHRFSPQL